MRQLGGHLLRFAETVARLRGALSVAGSWEALRSEFDRKLPGLLYHHVGPSPSGDPQAITVSPERFEQQMRWLARRGYTGITLSAWLCWRREGTGLPEKPIIITSMTLMRISQNLHCQSSGSMDLALSFTL
jgi:hypothetical protein